MRFAVDGWAPDYGSSQQEADELAQSVAALDPAIERPPHQWAPIAGSGVPAPTVVLFVDGIRREDARLWIESDAEAAPHAALCASYAAGVVRSTPSSATVEVAEVRRVLVSTLADAEDLPTRFGTWTAVPAKADPARPVFDVLSLALQHKLAELEIVCAADARAHAPQTTDDLLVIDGPLLGRTKVPRAIGVIKTHHISYLPPELNRVTSRLEPGERTPVFLLGTTWERYTWYLRLPGASSAPRGGVVRVECSPDVTVAEAIGLAALSQTVLPRFASEPFREPRAPQNLYPVSGLERDLRHRLGDQALLRRGLLLATR